MVRILIAVAPCLIDVQEHAASEFIVIGNHNSTFAGGNVLALLQAEAADGSERSDILIVVTGHECLSCVFDNRNAGSARQLHNGFHLTRVPEQVRDDDGFGFVCDAIFNCRRSHVAGFRIDIAENRNGSLVDNRRQRSHISDRRCDDLIARFRIDGSYGQVNRSTTTVAGVGVFRTNQLREALFQLFDIATLGAG